MRPGTSPAKFEPIDIRLIHQRMMVRLDIKHPRECLEYTWPEIEMILELPPKGMSDVEVKPHAGRGESQTQDEMLASINEYRKLTPKQKLLRAMDDFR